MIEIKCNEMTVPMDQIRVNPWNPNQQGEFMKERLNRSIQRFGQVAEILVREVEGGYEIIDGEHRYLEMKDRGYRTAIVNNLGVLDDDKARMLTMVMNEIHGERNALKLSALLGDLSVDTDWSIYQEVLPFTALELKALLELSKDEPKPSSREITGDGSGPAVKWVDLKVAIHQDRMHDIGGLMEVAKEHYKVPKKIDPVLENGQLLKSLVLL